MVDLWQKVKNIFQSEEERKKQGQERQQLEEEKARRERMQNIMTGLLLGTVVGGGLSAYKKSIIPLLLGAGGGATLGALVPKGLKENIKSVFFPTYGAKPYFKTLAGTGLAGGGAYVTRKLWMPIEKEKVKEIMRAKGEPTEKVRLFESSQSIHKLIDEAQKLENELEGLKTLRRPSRGKMAALSSRLAHIKNLISEKETLKSEALELGKKIRRGAGLKRKLLSLAIILGLGALGYRGAGKIVGEEE